MNAFDDMTIDVRSFAYKDLVGQDNWREFSPTFGALTVIGATSYYGRLRVMGKQCQFQVKFSAATSIESAAGTDYLTLPIAANSASYAGMAVMTNDSTNVAVGICHIDVANSACYLPTQAASADIFNLAGWYEI